ncbi:MAG: phage tail protein [Ruminococcus sp.]|nr:phage tail protein [Ruminococcus sp.]
MYYIYMYDNEGVRYTVHSPDKASEGCIVTAANVVNEADKAGEVSFTVAKAHPLYNKFRKISSLIEVRQDKRIIWFGRVYGIRRDFFMNKTVTCEGALAFLEDISLMPYHYCQQKLITSESGAYNGYVIVNKTKWEHLEYILRIYNLRCHPDRKITFTTTLLGDLHTYPEINGTTSYISVMKEIRDKIIEDYDYVLMQEFYSEDGGIPKINVNLTRMPLCKGSQTVEFGKNLIDFEEYVDASEVYNTVIPVGAGNISVYSDNGEDEYSPLPLEQRAYYVHGGLDADINGMIDKVIEFDSITDRTDLWEAAQTVLMSGGGMSSSEFTINAVDLHLLDADTEAISVGQSIRVISKPHNIDTDFVCYKTDIDILNPDNSSYTFRKPQRMSPETMTEHLYSTVDGINKRLNRKLDTNRPYGVVKMSEENTSFCLSMEDEENGG